MPKYRSHVNGFTVGALALGFVSLGLVLIYSTSSVFSMREYGSQYHFFFRQVAFALLGLCCLAVLALGDYRDLRPYAGWILAGSGLLLLLVWVPGLGRVIRGARRWIDLGPVNFQPSELLKVTLVLYLAERLSRKGTREALEGSLREYLLVWAAALPFIGLVLVQRDLGSPVILVLLVLLLLFLAGARLRHLVLSLGAAAAGAGLLCLDPQRWERLLCYRDPWRDPFGSSYQLVQSLISLGKGGLLGVGLGNGTQKLFYLPDAHTDFIFAVMGEEVGLVGCYVFLLLFLLFIVTGVRIALRAPDLFGLLLACGLTFLIGIQMVMNVGIVIGMLPTKGMTLPFVSYGGSALMVTLAAVGLLISVARQGVLRSGRRP